MAGATAVRAIVLASSKRMMHARLLRATAASNVVTNAPFDVVSFTIASTVAGAVETAMVASSSAVDEAISVNNISPPYTISGVRIDSSSNRIISRRRATRSRLKFRWLPTATAIRPTAKSTSGRSECRFSSVSTPKTDAPIRTPATICPVTDGRCTSLARLPHTVPAARMTAGSSKTFASASMKFSGKD